MSGDGELSRPEAEELKALVGDATADALSDDDPESHLDIGSGKLEPWSEEGEALMRELEMGQVDEERMKKIWPSLSSDFHFEISNHIVQRGHPLYDVVLDLFKKDQEGWLKGHGIWG